MDTKISQTAAAAHVAEVAEIIENLERRQLDAERDINEARALQLLALELGDLGLIAAWDTVIAEREKQAEETKLFLVATEDLLTLGIEEN